MYHITNYTDPNCALIKNLSKITAPQRETILKDLREQNKPSALPISEEASESSVIIVVGGIDPNKPDDFLIGMATQMYSIQQDSWVELGQMPEPRNYHSAVFLRGKIFVAGGFDPIYLKGDRMMPSPTTFQFAIRSKKWRKRADMNEPRACHGACVVDDSVIVLGGLNKENEILSSVEVYHPESDQWSFLRKMVEPNMGMGCTVLDNTVWVLGGITAPPKLGIPPPPIIDHVFNYDPIQNSWFKKPPLKFPRAFSSAITIRREIWIWGGICDTDIFNEPESIDNIEVFIPFNADWTQPLSLPLPKHGCAIAKSGPCMYCIGGISWSTLEPHTAVHCFDLSVERFYDISCLPYGITGAAAVGIPNFYAKEPNKAIYWEVMDGFSGNDAEDDETVED